MLNLLKIMKDKQNTFDTMTERYNHENKGKKRK